MFPRAVRDHPTIPAAIAGTGRQQLFLDVLSSTPTTSPGVNDWYTPARPSVADPKTDFLWGVYGPSDNFVEQLSEWAWVNTNGDWIDATFTSQGTTPWFSFTANAVTTGVHAYTGIDVSTALQAVQTGGRWNAFLLRKSGSGARSFATKHTSGQQAPSIFVTYVDTTTETLPCLAFLPLNSGTTYTQLGASAAAFDFATSLALEFQRPSRAVFSAVLTITGIAHDATVATIQGYLADPPLTPGTVTTGLAAGYNADSGISADPAVIVAHDYRDGTVLTDWMVTGAHDVFDAANWSPDLLGLGGSDASKLPTAFNGTPLTGAIAGIKWLEKQTANISLVSSSYSGEGFAPLAPGVGALRTFIPKSSAVDGAALAAVGALGSDAVLYFPKAQSGNLNIVFVRYYARLGTNATSPKFLSDTKMYRQAGGSATYAVSTGKWGIGAQCLTPGGGNADQGGGNKGWSNRNVRRGVPADIPAPGLIVGTHTEDMIPNTNQFWGQGGDRGAAMYPGIWRCIEAELDLNTFNPSGGSPSDGVQRVWIDDVLVSTHSGWQYRDGPLQTATTQLVPFRTIGPLGLWMNDYEGGVLPIDEDQTFFYTQLVVATSRIGRLGSASSGIPAWISGMPLNTWLAIPASNTLADLNPDNDATVNPNFPSTAPWRSGGNFTSQCGAWTGAVPRIDTGEVYWCNNGGHNDGYDAATYKLVLNAVTPSYVRVNKPSGAVGLTALNYSTEFARGTKQIDANGRHRSQHTENFQFYWPSIGICTVSGILLCNSGGNETGLSQPYISSPSTGEMTFLGANNNNNAAGGYDSGCYDSFRNVAWKKPSSSSNPFSKWGGPTNDVWTNVGSGDYLGGPVGLCYIPTLDLILVGNGGDDQGSGLQTIVGGWGVFDPVTGVLYAQGVSGSFPTFTGAPALNSPWATGLFPGLTVPQWEPSLGACLAWHNKTGHETAIMRITPPTSGDPRTGTWTVDYLPVSGSNTVTPSVSQLTGTYGRFAVFPSLGICTVVNSVSEKGYAFKYRSL